MARKHPYILNKRRLARGGYAEVFPATHRTTGVQVAFKRLHHPDDAESVDRMRREFEVQSSLTHPHIMPVLDAADDFTWIVMPLAAGDLLSLRTELDSKAIMSVLDSVADALEFAHARGIVHRDVTPRNILSLGSGAERRWVLGDWGLVRRAPGETTKKHTKAGVSFGTQGFAAPELSRDAHSADQRVDVYGLGRVTGWAVTGTWPEPNLPLPSNSEWDSFIQMTTHPNPARRVANMREFRLLLRLVGRKGVMSESEYEIHAKYAGDALGVREEELVGIWHAAPCVPAGYAARFRFAADGTYHFSQSQMDLMDPVRSHAGKWSIKNDQLVLNVERKLFLVGGQVSDEPPFGQHITGAATKALKLVHPQELSLTLGLLERDGESSPYPSRVIGDTSYWKLTADPDDEYASEGMV